MLLKFIVMYGVLSCEIHDKKKRRDMSCGVFFFNFRRLVIGFFIFDPENFFSCLNKITIDPKQRKKI